ncbi:hypothetical protein UNDYM_4719 [Undibacterium sp. YM2]|uniref:hypothetical protein n=1 Tax=Undibacterium sp. YM2 TaxID=2058625 RepID=UPI001331DBAC|nr:hypothetical protein [Undibacterium sp. YM2]BBB68972.1 hypothetical protein UNDYM_4719 [Undibacterium sp. YM2]
MRLLTDKAGFTATLESIHGLDSFSGLLEATPFLLRKLRQAQMRRTTEQPGHHFPGMDDLTQELRDMPSDYQVWPDKEYWYAKLVRSPEWSANRRLFVVLYWYQEGDDPLKRLEEIVSTINLEQCMAYEEYSYD